MIVFKIAPVLLLVLAARAEKKIELQDIEEDNLKSEREKELEKIELPTHQSNFNHGLLSLDFLKNGLFRYFDNSPTHPPMQFHQYAVTENPERSLSEPDTQKLPPFQQQNTISSSQPGTDAPRETTYVVTPHQHRLTSHMQTTQKHPLSSAQSNQQQHRPTTPQQAMLGYMSNVPMQIYLVPQYYNQEDRGMARASPLPGGADVGSLQNDLQDGPYPVPTAKAFLSQHHAAEPPPYIHYSGPPPLVIPTTATTTVGSIPVVYQMPIVQYQVVAENLPKRYYQQTPQYEINGVEEERDESSKYYARNNDLQTEVYTKSQDERNYYTTGAPTHHHEYRHNQITELPNPSPLLLKGSPPHLSHVAKALPMLRPLSRPLYPGHHVHLGPPQRPTDSYLEHSYSKRRPSSLLDSYIPSNLQVEYMKKGYTNDPIVAYESLSRARHLPPHFPVFKPFERGFLPNQMYRTPEGITFGHYKRRAKSEKVPQH